MQRQSLQSTELKEGKILQDFHQKMGKLTFEGASITLQKQLLEQLAISVA